MERDSHEQFTVNNFHEYYSLISIPEIQLLMEQECFQRDRNLHTNIKSDRTNNKNSTSTTEIIIALGFIATLLCLAGIQLHRSINVGSAKGEKPTEKVVTINRLESLQKITPKQFAWRIYQF